MENYRSLAIAFYLMSYDLWSCHRCKIFWFHYQDIKVSMACSICIETFSIPWTSTLHLDEWMIWIPLKKIDFVGKQVNHFVQEKYNCHWHTSTGNLCYQYIFHMCITSLFESSYLITIARYVIKHGLCVLLRASLWMIPWGLSDHANFQQPLIPPWPVARCDVSLWWCFQLWR